MRGRKVDQIVAFRESSDNVLARSRYNGILRIVDEALSARDYREFLGNITNTLSSLFDADLVTVYLLSQDGREFVEQTSNARRFSQGPVDYSRLPREVGSMSLLLAGRQLVSMKFSEGENRGSAYNLIAAEAYTCAVSIPMFIDTDVFGFCTLVYGHEVSLPKRDLDYLLAVGHLLGIIFKRVYSDAATLVHAGDLRECHMLSHEIKKELEAILAQTRAEKPETLTEYSKNAVAADERPISPGDTFRPTYREVQLMVYAADGLTNKEIADKLAVSESAVKKMFVRLAKNSGLRNRAHIAAYAVRNGFTI